MVSRSAGEAEVGRSGHLDTVVVSEIAIWFDDVSSPGILVHVECQFAAVAFRFQDLCGLCFAGSSINPCVV